MNTATTLASESPSRRPPGTTRILVVDDSVANRRLLVAMIKEAGYRALTARDGLEAVTAVERLQPDLVLMDVNMPRMDGLEAARRIKQITGERFTPVIFVTGMGDQRVQTDCLAAGGDDFVTKPVELPVLQARVQAQLRTARLYREQYERRQELTYYRDMAEREQHVAKRVFRAITRRETLDAAHIRYRLSPMSTFNGDLVLAATTPDGNTHLLVGDFTGHGLAAAIGALPASDIFYAMSAKGYTIGNIIREINDRLHGLLPVGMFLAACGLEANDHECMLEVWNAGLPAALWCRKALGRVEPLPSISLPLGVVSSAELETAPTRHILAPGDRVLLYTDGVTEAEGAEGGQYGDQRLRAQVEALLGREDLFDRVLADLDAFRGETAQTDDITLVQFESRATQAAGIGAEPPREPTKAATAPATTWRLGLRLEGPAFQRFDPRPLVTQLVMEIQGLDPHKNQLFTILSELFANALDHGLLGLDSGLKAGPEGFARYFAEREARLAALKDGWIDIHLNHEPVGEGGRLLLRVEDSGPGFDYAAHLQAPPPGPEAFSGRGITLLRNLCAEVRYEPPGNRVQIRYDWP